MTSLEGWGSTAELYPLNISALLAWDLQSVNKAPSREVVEGGGFEPPKLARQIYSLIPLATREPLPQESQGSNPGSLTQGRHFIGIGGLVQAFHRDFLNGSD